MRKSVVAASLISLCCFGNACAQNHLGGFSGPTATNSYGVATQNTQPQVAINTVEEVKAMRDDMRVVLQGNLIMHLGKDEYLFKDATGTINVEIDHDIWNGQMVTPENLIEIRGEVDKDRHSIEIDVKSIQIIR